MIHWLYIQLLLTLQEIHTQITIPRMVAGIVGYTIIHKTILAGTIAQKEFDKHRKHAISHSAGQACIKDDLPVSCIR